MASHQRSGAAGDAGGGSGGGQKRLALPTITTTAPGSNQEKLSIPVRCHLHHHSHHDDNHHHHHGSLDV